MPLRHRGRKTQLPAWRREIRSVQQLAFLTLWDRLRGPQEMPRLSALQADDLRRAAETIMFCDVTGRKGAQQFIVRYQGSFIRRLFVCNATGLLLDAPEIPPVERLTVQDYNRVADSRAPFFRAISLHLDDAAPARYERLLLPFSSKGAGADRILCVLSLFCQDNGFPPDILTKARFASI